MSLLLFLKTNIDQWEYNFSDVFVCVLGYLYSNLMRRELISSKRTHARLNSSSSNANQQQTNHWPNPKKKEQKNKFLMFYVHRRILSYTNRKGGGKAVRDKTILPKAYTMERYKMVLKQNSTSSCTIRHSSCGLKRTCIDR